MKFTCQKDDIHKVLAATEAITNTKTNFSILSNVLIETGNNNTVKVKASNMEITFIGSIQAKIAKSGKITIFQNKLAEVIRELPAGDILFELTSANIIKIKSLDKKRRAKTSIHGLPANDFPDIPPFPEQQNFITIDKLYFKKMIQKTIFAVSTDNMKYTLNGVYLENKKNNSKMVAIDGRRLAIINSKLSSSEHDDFATIIPHQFLMEMQKIITDEGPLAYCFANNRLHFKLDNYFLSTNILSGKFPDYNMFIPEKHKNFFSVKTEDLIKAVKLASVMVDTESHKIIFHINDTNLQIAAENNEYGQANEELLIHYEGESISFGLNYKLLIEILKQIEVEETQFSFTNASSPVLIKEKGRDEYFYIIMPMKLD